jgi:hypothetical protein
VIPTRQPHVSVPRDSIVLILDYGRMWHRFALMDDHFSRLDVRQKLLQHQCFASLGIHSIFAFIGGLSM